MFYLKKKFDVTVAGVPLKELEDTLRGTSSDPIVLALRSIMNNMIMEFAMAPVHDPEIAYDEVKWLLGKTSAMMEIRSILDEMTQ
tara:strand:+ start:499 stop:753 length:255 start_codon:yes stop_codon:yes gene_type:complete